MVRFSCVKPMTNADTSSTWRAHRVATLLRVSAAAFAILTAHSARAELADPESFVALIGGDYALVGPGVYTKAFGSTANTGSVSYSPASISAFGGYTAGARLAYQFSIVGPADVPVPVSISFDLSTSGTYDPTNPASYYYSLSLFNLSRNPDLEGLGAVIACSDSRRAGNNQCENFKNAPFPLNVVGPSFLGSEGFVVGSNTDQWLSLYTYFQSGDGTGFAFADPRIAIDPSFLADNPGFSLVLSPGIGNTVGKTPVPEPAGWITLALGLVGLRLVRRRRSAE